MFEGVPIKEIFKWMFLMGIVLVFLQMIPPALVRSAKWIIAKLKKEKVEELKKELGGQCMSETECQDRLKAAVKDEIGPPLDEIKASLKRVHTRIDEHLNSSVKVA